MSYVPSSPPPGGPTEIYAVFSDNINQASVQRVFNAFAFGTANKIQHVHLLFQSCGGFVGDGICLYNFFKSLPIDRIRLGNTTVDVIARFRPLVSGQPSAELGDPINLERGMQTLRSFPAILSSC
jgi:hypothetical protein